ncbi:MAG: DUF1553 domain-containing protein [Planctomycetaceae bacterium]
MKLWFVATLTLLLPSISAAGDVDFANDIAPIFEQHCLRCHNPGNAKGDFSLATIDHARENGYLNSGEPDASYLLELVTPPSENEPPAMPKDGEPLSDEQRELLRTWIVTGAEWPEEVMLREPSLADKSWWSFQSLADNEPPTSGDAPTDWQTHPLDRFVFAGMTEKGLTPSQMADRRTLIRRATYDLLGLPPTPEEIAAFEADDAPDSWERLIDRLLESPHYGERWGRHWLDVTRFGESRGFERNEIINNAWPFRDYVIKSFNDDKPFDQFTREQLAGDVIGADDPDVAVATTYLVCGPYDDVGNQDAAQAAQIRANTIDDIIRATSEAFLGLTVGCARCHDHKFDPIRQTDYYALYATLAGVTHGQREVATAEQRQTRHEQLAPLEEQRNALQQQIDAIEQAIRYRAKQQESEIAAEWTRPPVSRQLTEENFEPIDVHFVRLTVEGSESNPASDRSYLVDEFEVWTPGESSVNVALATNGGRAIGDSRVAQDFDGAYSVDLVNDGRFGARWIPNTPQLTIELPQSQTIDHVSFSSDRKGDSVGHSVAAFVSEYRIEVSANGEEWTPVADSYDRQPINEAHRNHRLREAVITGEERQQLAELRKQLGDVNGQIAAVPALPVWWVGNFSRPAGPFHVFLGGDPQKHGEEVTPASLTLFDEVASPPSDLTNVGQARASLAEWIVDPDNPLTPRVLVNRVWQYHFGKGIVDTPSDFGAMGGQPSHPALLDWLARRLITSESEGGFGWRLKPLHKFIMLTQTYQQSSAARDEAIAVDADSRLLWRFPPRRLSAEEIRDTMLSITGKLDTRMGGPGSTLPLPAGQRRHLCALEEHGPETYRRAVYHQNARASVIDLMSEFDCPDPAFAAPRRSATTTPLQALTLMNHDFTLDMADALAARVAEDTGEQPNDQIERAFVLAFGRAPDPNERDTALPLLNNTNSTPSAAYC